MSRSSLPAAAVLARRELAHSACPPRALAAWNPGIRAAAGEGDGAISIFDVIGYDWWTGEGVTAKQVAGALRAVGDADVVVNINSPGGDYFEGLAIYNLLREHKGRVTVKVLGIAASAASVIAMAGDEVQVARAGFLMIHNAWVCACGDRNQLRETADWLEPFDATATDIYAVRTGLAATDLAVMLDKETWIGGAEAVDKRFADALLASDQVMDDPQQRERGERLRAERTADNLGRIAGASRAEIRQLVQDLKRVTPGADDDHGKPGAADASGLRSLLTDLRAL
ncbi:MAG TPA: head maturation protease, ClpP-related [Brevundimonas sp.]|nr:head maturation protease, ClpP-related [Brevundimonas sp.]